MNRRDAARLLPASLFTACSRRTSENVLRLSLYPVLDSFPLYLAIELGHIRMEGLEVEASELQGGSKIMEALIGGSLDVASDCLIYAVIMAAQGRLMKSFFNLHEAGTGTLVVSPHAAHRIKNVSDLKGALVGIASFGGMQYRYLAYHLRQSGLSESDARLTVIGLAASALAAVEHGKVDAAMMAESSYEILANRAPGSVLLLNPRSENASRQLFGVDAFPGTLGLLATSEWLGQNSSKARKLTRGMIRTLRWIEEHPADEVLDRVPSHLKTSDRKLDLRILRTLMRVLSKDGRIPRGGPEAVQRMLAASMDKAASINLASTWTNEFVEAQ